MLDDPRVMPCRQHSRAGPARERKKFREAELSVAADAGVRRVAARIAADERRDDGAAELLPQVERHVRQPERVAGGARGANRLRRAARALGGGTPRVEPEAEGDAERLRT